MSKTASQSVSQPASLPGSHHRGNRQNEIVNVRTLMEMQQWWEKKLQNCIYLFELVSFRLGSSSSLLLLHCVKFTAVREYITKLEYVLFFRNEYKFVVICNTQRTMNGVGCMTVVCVRQWLYHHMTVASVNVWRSHAMEDAAKRDRG